MIMEYGCVLLRLMMVILFDFIKLTVNYEVAKSFCKTLVVFNIYIATLQPNIGWYQFTCPKYYSFSLL